MASGKRGSYDPVATRQALLDSAVALFGEYGFHAASVREIVERAEGTKGAFYHHFESKEDVLALIDDAYYESQRALTEKIRTEIDSPAEQIRELMRSGARSLASNRLQFAVFYHERRHLTGDHAAEVKRKREWLNNEMMAIVEEGIERGEFSAQLNPQIAVFGMVGMLVWMEQWYREGGGSSPESLGDELANLLIDGLTGGKA
jgi:AcrR family transcriptional regulator